MASIWKGSITFGLVNIPVDLRTAVREDHISFRMAEPFDPSKYSDDYRASLMKVIRAKMKGKKIKYEEPETDDRDTGVFDLMAKLQASLEQAKPKRGPVRVKKGAPARETKRAKTA